VNYLKKIKHPSSPGQTETMPEQAKRDHGLVL
jgi:hypothetical protein